MTDRELLKESSRVVKHFAAKLMRLMDCMEVLAESTDEAVGVGLDIVRPSLFGLSDFFADRDGSDDSDACAAKVIQAMQRKLGTENTKP